MDQSSQQRVIKWALRYVLRVVLVLILVVGLAWFFLFRSPSKHADTSATDTTTSQTSQKPVTPTDTGKAPSTTSSTTGKVGTAASTDGKTSDETTGKNLVDTGPADVAVIFGASVIAGVIAWEWHLRRLATQRQ